MTDELTEVMTEETPAADRDGAAGALHYSPGTGVEMVQVGKTLAPGESGTLTESGPEGETPAVDPEAVKLHQAALQIAMQIRQVVEAGEPIVMLLVKPDLAEKFEAAFRQVPEKILPADFVARLPIMADPDCEGVRVIVQADLIREFLLRYYGPTSEGGNGLIQALEDAISRIPNCPMRIDLKSLETLFLLELKERVKPGIVVPTGANLRQGLPNLRQ